MTPKTNKTKTNEKQAKQSTKQDRREGGKEEDDKYNNNEWHLAEGGEGSCGRGEGEGGGEGVGRQKAGRKPTIYLRIGFAHTI